MQSETQGESRTPPVYEPRRNLHRGRRFLLLGAAAAGAAIGGAGIAAAATGSSTSTNAPSTASGSSGTPAPAPIDPAKLSHGPNETLLTGTTADKVKAAALAADPGATIIRVETDSDGSPYEAHITKADGTQVTLKIDANFKVTSTDQGFGGGHGPGGQAPGGGVPGGGAPSTTAPSAYQSRIRSGGAPRPRPSSDRTTLRGPGPSVLCRPGRRGRGRGQCAGAVQTPRKAPRPARGVRPGPSGAASRRRCDGTPPARPRRSRWSRGRSR